MQAIKKIYLCILTTIILLAPQTAHGMDPSSSTSLTVNNLPKAQRDLLAAFMFSFKNKCNQYPPTLLLEEIIEIINNNNETFTPLTQDHIDWLQSPHPVIQPTSSYIRDFEISPDNQYLAVKFENNSVQLFTTDNYSPIGTEFKNVLQYTFRPDGKQLLIRCFKDLSRLYHTHNATLVNNGTFKDVITATFSSDSHYLSIKKINSRQLYKIEPHNPILMNNEKLNGLKNFQFSPNSKYLLAEKKIDNSTILFNLHTKDLSNQKLPKAHKALSYLFSPNDKYLFIRYLDANELFNTDDLSKINIDKFPCTFNRTFSPDSKHLLMEYLHPNDFVDLFNLEDLSHISHNDLKSDYCSADFSPNNKYLTIKEFISIKFFNKDDFSPIKIEPNVSDFEFSPDDKYVLIKRINNSAQLLHTDDFTPVNSKPLTDIDTYEFSPDSSYLIIKKKDKPTKKKPLYLYILDPQKELHSVNQKVLNLIDKLFKNRQNNNTTLSDDEQKSYNLLPTALKMALCKYISTKNT